MAKSVHGRIMGGQQPVVGSTVSIYALGYGGNDAALLAQTTTDENGNFAFNTNAGNTYVCPAGPLAPSVSGVPETAHPAANSSAAAPYARKLAPAETRAGANSSARPAAFPDLTQAYVYVTAAGGDSGTGSNSGILLAAGLGSCADAQNESVEINEVTTVVFVSAMVEYDVGFSNFKTYGSSPQAIAAMDMADTNTVQTFVDLSTGMVKPNVVASGPGETSVTIEAAKIYSLANVLAACVNSADGASGRSQVCRNLFTHANQYFSPIDTLDAMDGIALQPFRDVAYQFALVSPTPPFPGGLSTAPNDWTLGISYTTNSMGLGLFPASDGSPTGSNIDIDSSGRVWFPSNKSGATGVGYFDPTELTFTGPLGGAYLKQPQYVALAGDTQTAYVTDLGSNNIATVNTTPGGTNSTGVLTIPADGLGPLPSSAGPLFVTANDALALAYNNSAGGHDMYVFDTATLGGAIVAQLSQAAAGLTLNNLLGSDPNNPANPVAMAATSGPSSVCSLETVGASNQGTLPATVSTPAANSPCVSGGAATGPVIGNYTSGTVVQVQEQVTTWAGTGDSGDGVCSQVMRQCFTLLVLNPTGTAFVSLVSQPRGIAFDGGGLFWMANSGNASIGVWNSESCGDVCGYGFSSYSDRPYMHGAADGGTMISPAGIAIDSAGNVWVSNATCTGPTDTTCAFTLSEVIGAGYPTITPVSSQANQLQGKPSDVSSSPFGTVPLRSVSKLPRDTIGATSVLKR